MAEDRKNVKSVDKVFRKQTLGPSPPTKLEKNSIYGNVSRIK
jgi:hypothetical protein